MTHDPDPELSGSYLPAPCFNCGTMEDPRIHSCYYCDSVICRWCDLRPVGLPFNHLPGDHLLEPEVCDICGSLDVATQTKGYGILCAGCTLDQLGLCRDCGSLHTTEDHCWVFPDDRRFPPGP